jgi:hypothetical protein
MKTKEELKKIYEELNESEKFGVQFALFPVKLMGLNKEEIVALMDLRGEIEKSDINKRG